MREPDDCFNEVGDLAKKLLSELELRYSVCYPPLNSLLYRCLDFDVLFGGLCTVKDNVSSNPVNKQIFSEIGSAEFSECVKFVSNLPYIKEKNLEIGVNFSDAIHWRFKRP